MAVYPAQQTLMVTAAKVWFEPILTLAAQRMNDRYR
jgi:hypothetical protein